MLVDQYILWALYRHVKPSIFSDI